MGMKTADLLFNSNQANVKNEASYLRGRCYASLTILAFIFHVTTTVIIKITDVQKHAMIVTCVVIKSLMQTRVLPDLTSYIKAEDSGDRKLSMIHMINKIYNLANLMLLSKIVRTVQTFKESRKVTLPLLLMHLGQEPWASSDESLTQKVLLELQEKNTLILGKWMFNLLYILDKECNT